MHTLNILSLYLPLNSTLNNRAYEKFKYFSCIPWRSRCGCCMRYFVCSGKGEDTRLKISEALRKRGIKLDRKQLNDLVDEIASEVKGDGE